MTRKPPARLVALAALFLTAPAGAGEFDRLEGDALATALKGDGVKKHEALSLPEIEGLPPTLGDNRAAFLLVKTGQGNVARILITPALRKAPGAQATPVPVLVLDRFDTFEPGKSGSRVAKGAGLLLFEGFQVDLDAGQVVPEGQGGDLELVKGSRENARLKAVGGAELYTLTRPFPAPASPGGPSPGKTILPGDLAGRFRLNADGRFTGLLELEVAPDRQITGRFRSEANGTSYPVKGQVSAESPQKAEFVIKYPRVEQEYVAYLWTEGKNVLGGSFTMGDRVYGFVAVREGAKLGTSE